MKVNISAVITSLVLSICISCMALEPQHEDLFKAGEYRNKGYRIPAIVTTDKGTLIVACDARVSTNKDLPNNIDIAVRRSTDNGKTWSSMKIVIDYPGKEGVCDPCILFDRDTKTVWIFVLYGPERIGLFASQVAPKSKRGRIIAVKSKDEGKTWSKPVDLDGQVNSRDWFCALAAPGSGIQMRNGTLVVPG